MAGTPEIVEFVKAYLTRKGYEILGEGIGKPGLIAARDVSCGEIAFVAVVGAGEGDACFPPEPKSSAVRGAFEEAAMTWLSENPVEDGKVRFDIVALKPLSSNRCFLRQHIDCLGVGM